jgi:transcription-repair coupling factor (superfamily II helicase)
MAGAEISRDANRRLPDLPAELARQPDFQQCLRRLARERTATFDSVWGSACALLTAALLRAEFPLVLVIAPTDQAVDELAADLESFATGAHDRFPAYDTSKTGDGVDLAWGDRIRLLKSLAAGRAGKLLLTSIQAILQAVPDAAFLRGVSRRLEVGGRVDPNEFKRWLAEAGFHATPVIELPGEFAARGGIVDVFAADWANPVRIEWFDEVVESIREFDIETQRSTRPLPDVELTLGGQVERMRASLLDYLPEASLIVLIHPQELQRQGEQFVHRHDDRGALFPWEALARRWGDFPLATVHELAAGSFANSFQLTTQALPPVAGDSAEVRVQLDRAAQEFDAIVVARVEGEIPRLVELLQGTETARRGRLQFAVGCISAGFRWLAGRAVVIGCDQMFHRGQLRRSPRRKLGKAIDSFLDLREGDLVVHLAHGIGRYRGMKLLEKAGLMAEHLELEFHGGTRIFVPATKIDLVQKYIGGSKSRPALARIGGKSWIKQKQATQEAITDLAAEMLEIQAKRSMRSGIVFDQDTLWQHEFEQSFPFRETPDQNTAIASIKRDMESQQPMDRLLCGDVGFGKTEIAMRSAFKAVENGYQVAVLVPTTILAEQHYRSFRERLAEFPFDIARLSRFSSGPQIKDTLSKLRSGQIDIAIGTHRLVSADVEFKNLGLIIIDEEQRFGVEHKERLKKLRDNADVLTMSATPIPRTLHMSLVGVRDISNLETPPDDRMAVETHVTRFNAELIRHAILREINRGGQVYFVHNRVNDIHELRLQLESIVPEATIAVGHAQMPDHELDRVMTEFIAGQHDVLLATTIVESGLDIPNANTMFIDEADRYGLADLHQLRGRVGRYKHRAYCYLLLHPHKHLNPTAAKRLQAIETFSEMGAGFAIAMRDLEIRGAGNLLGTEQSGHIATVGYELYCQMLEAAVRRLKQMPQKFNVHVDIDLPGVAYLPDDYVPDRKQKIDIYRRLTRIEQFTEIESIRSELVDRFGRLPRPAERLLALADIKLEAAIWQIQAIYLQDNFLGFRYGDQRRIEQLAGLRKGKIRIVDSETALIPLRSTAIDSDRLLALVKAILHHA